MTDRQQLRAELERLDETVAAEREAVSRLRRQLDAFRQIPAPTVGAQTHPQERAADELRVVLAAHRDALTRALASRDRVAADLERAKQHQPAATAA